MIHKEATTASPVTFYDEDNRPINNPKSYQGERPKGYEGTHGWIPWDTEQDQGPLPIEQDGSPIEETQDD